MMYKNIFLSALFFVYSSFLYAQNLISPTSILREGEQLIFQYTIPDSAMLYQRVESIEVTAVTSGRSYTTSQLTGELYQLQPGLHTLNWNYKADAFFESDEISVRILLAPRGAKSPPPVISYPSQAFATQAQTFKINTINLTGIQLVSPITRGDNKTLPMTDSLFAFEVKADCEAPLRATDFTILLNNKPIKPKEANCSTNHYNAIIALPAQEQQLSFSVQVRKGNTSKQTELIWLTREIVSTVSVQTEPIIITPPHAALAKGKRVALVIGNGDYTYLTNLQGKPQRDQQLIRKKLEGLGFLVTTYSDVTRASFEKSIKEFVSKAKGSEAIVVYYAGHGIESNGINYLLPTDARLDERDDAEFQGIPLDRVLVKVGEAGPKLSLVLLDACRTNPFANRVTRGDDDFRGFKPTEVKASNQLILYATQTGRLATNEGLFANAIQEHLQPGIELMQFVKSITRSVKGKSKERQVPAQYGSISEDFVF